MRNNILLLFIALFALSCSQEKNLESHISGHVENSPNGLISLIGSGYEKDIILEEDGSFTTELNLPYSGYYNAIFGRIPLSLFLEQGKSLTLELDLEQISESLTFEGDLGLENTYLADKKEIEKMNLREFYALDAEEFTNGLDELHSKLSIALDASEITNKKFIDSQKDEFDYTKSVHLNTYKDAHGYLTQNEDVVLPEDFYSPLSKINFSDTLNFRVSNGYQRAVQTNLKRLTDELPEEENKNKNLQYMELVNKNFPDGYAKNELLKSAIGYELKPDKYLEPVYELFMANQSDTKLRDAMEEAYSSLSKITPGNESPSFDYENFNGGTTSLESLKGKYVYIDVWATWCVPCLNEAPYLKEVAKDYSDKDIVFVAISADEQADYDKWRTMVEEKDLAGIHLYAGGDAWKADFATSYRINSIPRFILIDPEGKIFDADTYRPSDVKLRDLLDELL